MCFSAPASFTASAVLAIVGGVLSFRIKSKRLLPLACVPLFFAIQQAAEGVEWLHLPESSPAKNIFLFFAYVVWPIWIPFSLWLIEDNAKRKQWLAFCLGIGIVIGAFLILMIPETYANRDHGSIQYLQYFLPDRFNTLGNIFYVTAILLPCFVTSLKKFWILGALVACSALITFWVNQLTATSTWCFFAALLSLSLFFILEKTKLKKLR